MSERRVEAVVIGGSAGALDALRVLLPALPGGCAVPVVIVLHMSGTRPSQLPEVLARRTVLPVEEAADKARALPGVVYVAPPNYHLLVERDRSFALSADEPIHFSRPAIDVLFESAADAYGEGLVGIILTGANEDGARGLAAVQQAGGLAVVQSPEEAQVAVMPRAAIAATGTDAVLPLAEIASLLGRLVGVRGADAEAHS
ncbi:MAG TPA: chemotaxis protein CheB [Polyangia bacterium]|nr:chemotaxis protein CheB [Polyangia bacterium]